MFQNSALDVAFGLAVMYLVLSLFCTLVNEYIATKLSLRSKSLAAGIREILDDAELLKAFYAHGLIAATSRAVVKAAPLRPATNGTSQAATAGASAIPLKPATIGTLQAGAAGAPAAPAGTVPTQGTPLGTTGVVPAAPQTVPTPEGLHPSYISSETFVLALTNVLARRNQGGKTVDALSTAIAGLRQTKIKDVLEASLLTAEADVDKFRHTLADWFDDSMDRLSGAYKRNLKWISIVVGCAVAVLLNADSVVVGTALWTDGTLRAEMVQVAMETANAADKLGEKKTGSVGTQVSPAKTATPVVAPAPTGTPTPTEEKPTAESTTPSPDAAPNIDTVVDNFSSASGQLRPLPVGWTAAGPCQLSAGTKVTRSYASCPDPGPENWFWFYLFKILGWFVTGLALSLGAPFWFDTLSQFINIRGTGVKPERAAPAK